MTAPNNQNLCSAIVYPEDCHFKDEKPTGYVPSISEIEAQLPPRPATDTRRTNVEIICRFFLYLTGIPLVMSLMKRCFGASRKHQAGVSTRERQRCDVEHQQGSHNCMSGCTSGQPRRRSRGDDEKRAIEERTELYLDGQMQVEIQQLRIQEELERFRTTRDAVHEMIHAEDGRSQMGFRLPYSSDNGFITSTYMNSPQRSDMLLVHGSPIRPFIRIPPRSNTDQFNQEDDSSTSPASFSGLSSSPVSRTTSLPSYRSKPPSYRDNDSYYALSEDDDHPALTSSDASSMPDLSPRMSIETMRTYMTGEAVRSFLQNVT